MICPGCGKTIKRTNFCPECGHHLTTTDQAVDQIGKYSRTKSSTIPVGMIVCPGCCNTVTEGKRCPLCNYQLEDDEPSDPTFQEMFGDGIILKDDKPRRINFSNPVTIVILIWAAFAAAFALLMFLSN
jgi:predicted amidophosphoribosyltransferase